jgi:2',3'-cyclic-nucleotide 2'-phosphodiesterase
VILYGKPGYDMLRDIYLNSKKLINLIFIIILNAENAANGRGINLKIYKEIMSLGVHMCTMGNWVWGHKELFEFIDEANIVRPFNFYEAPGKGAKIIIMGKNY